MKIKEILVLIIVFTFAMIFLSACALFQTAVADTTHIFTTAQSLVITSTMTLTSTPTPTITSTYTLTLTSTETPIPTLKYPISFETPLPTLTTITADNITQVSEVADYAFGILSQPLNGIPSFSTDDVFAVNSDEKTYIFDLSIGNVIKTIDAPFGRFSKDGTLLATADWRSGDKLILWDAKSFSLVSTYNVHVFHGAYAWSPDTESIAAVNLDRKLVRLSVKNPEATQQFTGRTGDTYDIEFSPDGNWLSLVARANIANVVTDRLWKVQDDKYQYWSSVDLKTEDWCFGRPFIFFPDSSTIAGYQDKHIYKQFEVNIVPTFFSVPALEETGKLPVAPDVNQYWFGCTLAINPDGTLLAVDAYEPSTQKYIVQFWRVTDRELLYSIPLTTRNEYQILTGLTFSPNGRFIILTMSHSLSETDIWIWGIPNK